MKGLFLDDERLPNQVEEWIAFNYLDFEWQIVRNYDDFVKAVEEEEFDYISFDHDLDRSSTFECIRCNSSKEKFDYRRIKEKTGYHCAKFIKEHYTKQGKDIPKYIVHSLNEKGRENIIEILGKERLVATHSLELCFEKADEILKLRSTRTAKQ